MERLGRMDLNSLMGKQPIGMKFLLKTKELKKTKNGDLFLDATIADGDVSTSIKFWSFTPDAYDKLDTGRVYGAIVQVQSYNGKPSLIGNEIKPISEPASDYADVLKDREEWEYRMQVLIANITDNYYKSLVNHCLNAVGLDKFMDGVGAVAMHHTEIGGLLRHTVEVAECAKELCDKYRYQYGELNQDLAVAGAILHDVGKVYEYTVNPQLFTSEYNKANLAGHITQSLIMIGIAHQMVTAEIGSSSDNDSKLKLITNIVASHHGIKDWGACEQPKIIEAEIVFISDYISSAFDRYGKHLSQMKLGEYDTKFNIYKHQLSENIL